MRFIIQTTLDIFSPEEVEALRRYGRAFQKLMHGERTPKTPAHHHFVKGCRGEADPISFHEKLWRKYLDRVTWELNLENHLAMGGPRKADEDFGGSREDIKKMHRADRADFWNPLRS